MKVSHHRDIGSARHAAPNKQRSGKVDHPTSTPDFSASVALSHKLTNTAGVRSDQVALAKTRISDPEYPSREVIQAVANRLADGLRSRKTGA